MKFFNIPPLFRIFAGSRLHWNIRQKEKILYLSFDDGPHPEATPAVLKILEAHQIEATFFCVGENVQKYPEVYQEIRKQGHQVGNHTFHHLNGWKTPADEYLEDIAHCREYVDSDLFRPPYGRMQRAQMNRLPSHYHIILWSALAGDFDPDCDARDCLKRMIRFTRPGAIIVLHDNVKTIHKVLEILPDYIRYCMSKGYTFAGLTPQLFHTA